MLLTRLAAKPIVSTARVSKMAQAQQQSAAAMMKSGARQDSRSAHTIHALKRWSCQNGRDLPAVPEIKSIHVYDFDNTLFSSPLPNPQLWNGPTIGRLQNPHSWASGSSWWHDPAILASTGKGMDAEERVAWKGWWNEFIVQLVQLSMEQKDALTVLLTGRSEAGFAEIIKRIVKSRDLSFDIICLKPEVDPWGQQFGSTMKFKQAFLDDLLYTYKDADEMRIYEDRPRHIDQFREYFKDFNRRNHSPRKPISGKVIEVAELTTYLDPVAETAEVQRMVNAHNRTVDENTSSTPRQHLQIKRTIFFTGYLVSNEDSARLIKFLLEPMLPPGLFGTPDLRVMANNILITPRPAPKQILDKVGGVGKTVKWRVTATSVFDNKLWAVKVAPVNESEVIYTENPEPCIILALRKNARPADVAKIRNWRPVKPDDGIELDSTVGHRMLLRVEEEIPGQDEYESLFEHPRGTKRKQQQQLQQQEQQRQNVDSGSVAPSQMIGGPDVAGRGSGNGRQPPTGPSAGIRGGRGGRAARGGRHAGPGGRGGGGRGRGRGGYHHGYRSLDDSKQQQGPYNGGDDKGFNLNY